MTAMEWKQTAIPYGCSYAAKIIYLRFIILWMGCTGGCIAYYGLVAQSPLGDGGDFIFEKVSLKPERKADIRGGN